MTANAENINKKRMDVRIGRPPVNVYLSSYIPKCRMLAALGNEHDNPTCLCRSQKSLEADRDEFYALREDVAGIEKFIRTLPFSESDSVCRDFLRLHYLFGHSIECCAEELYLSRTTAYRVRKRALSVAAHAYERLF